MSVTSRPRRFCGVEQGREEGGEQYGQRSARVGRGDGRVRIPGGPTPDPNERVSRFRKRAVIRPTVPMEWLDDYDVELKKDVLRSGFGMKCAGFHFKPGQDAWWKSENGSCMVGMDGKDVIILKMQGEGAGVRAQ